MITCPYCKEQFEPDVDEDFFDLLTLLFDCPYCNREIEVENTPKIVWKRDSVYGRYYTTLVSRFKKIDGEEFQRFDYFDYMKAKK